MLKKLYPFNADTALMALSPLDGRYQSKLASLRQFYSEYGLIYYRLFVECQWLITLTSHSKVSVKPLSATSEKKIHRLLKNFTIKEAMTIKALENKTQHDVKAVEYYLRSTFEKDAVLCRYIPWLHFGLTSDDVNNLSHALMLKAAFSQVVKPWMMKIIAELSRWAKKNAKVSMLARTHGQAASPTTLGKECANFAYRLQRQLDWLKKTPIMGKCNGAVGNFNAMKFACSTVDWIALSKKFIHSLGLAYNPYTTQIEPHDSLAQWLQGMIRFNSVALDCVKDFWGYISFDYFTQKISPGTIGSSTMPHKVNPIHFENAEGNLGLANAIAQHCVVKLPISRFQRDLSDSTVLRNVGCILGYSVLAYQSITIGLAGLSPDLSSICGELNQHWEVLTEAIQTEMRKCGIENAYEKIKTFSHGQKLTKAKLHAFIDTLALHDAVKKKLKQLTPEGYLGESIRLANQIDRFIK
jgi:adenylosuccinate lyase